VCICLYIYIYLYIRLYIYKYMIIDVHAIYKYMTIHVHACMFVCVCVCTGFRLWMRLFLVTFACAVVHVRMHVSNRSLRVRGSTNMCSYTPQNTHAQMNK